MIPQFER
jgi:hypothetical protein